MNKSPRLLFIYVGASAAFLTVPRIAFAQTKILARGAAPTTLAFGVDGVFAFQTLPAPALLAAPRLAMSLSIVPALAAAAPETTLPKASPQGAVSVTAGAASAKVFDAAVDQVRQALQSGDLSAAHETLSTAFDAEIKRSGGSDGNDGDSVLPERLSEKPAKTAEIMKAFAEQPRTELAKTITHAAVESPLEYRSALRAALESLLPGIPRLQRHLAALDANSDGKVSLSESYETLRSLGFGRLKAALIAGGSQLALVVSTGRVNGFSFVVDGGPRGLHRTVDSGAMDPEQDLAKKLDEFMAEDVDHDGWIDMKDVGRLLDKRARMSQSGRIAKFFVKAANKAEFGALFGLLGGRMNRDDLHDFYTGSLFFSLLKPEALARRIVGLRERLRSR